MKQTITAESVQDECQRVSWVIYFVKVLASRKEATEQEFKLRKLQKDAIGNHFCLRWSLNFIQPNAGIRGVARNSPTQELTAPTEA